MTEALLLTASIATIIYLTLEARRARTDTALSQ